MEQEDKEVQVIGEDKEVQVIGEDKEVQVIGEDKEVQVIGEDKEVQVIGEDKEVQIMEEVSSEINCEIQVLSVMEDRKEQQASGDGSSKTGEVSNEFVIDTEGQMFRDNIIDSTRREPVTACIDSESDSDSDSDTSSSSVSSLSSFSSVEDLRDTEKDAKTTRQPKSIKTKGELGIEDLPPVEELTISVPADDMQKIGKVYSIVDQLVVVESYENSPPLDLDSVLFLDSGKPLGHIFEVFGPVKQPYYLIRFNSKEDIIKKGIAKEDSVFYAPSHSEVTNFIFTDVLMRQKGSDASWEHNNEPPEEHIDFSDDEKEMAARKKRAAKNRKPTSQEDDVAHKRPNTSSEATADGDAVTVVFQSRNNSSFQRSGSSSMPNGEVNTSFGTRKSYLCSASSQPHQQNPMPLAPAKGKFGQAHQNAASPYRSPRNFSMPSPFQPGPLQGIPSQQELARGFPVQQRPLQSIPSQQGPSYGMPPQQGPSYGMLPQQGPSYGMPPHQGPSHGMPPHQGSSHGMPPHQGSSHGMPPQQGPSHGMPPQQGPSHGMPPQQGPSHGMPPQQGPSHGMLPQQSAPYSMLPQQGSPQGMPPQQGPPQGMMHQGLPPQQVFAQHQPQQQGFPLHGGVNQSVSSSQISLSSQQVMNQPNLTSPPPALTPSRSFMPGFSGSPITNSGVSPFRTASALSPQWPMTSPGVPHSSYQQYPCNWNSFAPRNDLLQNYDEHSTQTNSNMFQMKVPQRFSFTENVQPRFGAPAVLPMSGLYRSESTEVPPPTHFWNTGKT